MTSFFYVIQSLPWIVAGLLVGFFMGRATVAADAIAVAVQVEGDGMARESTDSTSGKRRLRFTSNGVVAVLLVVLGVATAVQSYVQAETNERQATATERLQACQTAYSNGFADAIDARSTATQEAQDALDELLSTVASLTPTPDSRERFRDALEDYLDKRADAKRAQKEHPYPPAPRDVCRD